MFFSSSAVPIKPIVAGAVIDRFSPALYSAQPYEGYIGQRMEFNLKKSLIQGYSVLGLLAPFKARFEGNGDDANWPNGGEYAGKYIQAGLYTWKYSGDQTIRARIDSIVNGLISYQAPDGYMGTASPSNRWAGQGWDVWINKYCLKGLLSFYIEFGGSHIIEACSRIGDLMCATFGPGKLIPDIDKTSQWFLGLPSTALLESMALLYRYTGQQRYLDFCDYLITTESIKWVMTRTPNPGSCIGIAKVYETLVAYIGLLEMYRITGNADFLNCSLNAWSDLAKEHRGATGTVQIGDHTGLPNELTSTEWTEVCNAVYWTEFNWQLLRITGRPEFAHEMELSLYNCLLGSANPRTGALGNKVPVNGPRNTGTAPGGGYCCGANLIRAIAAIPEWFMAGSIGNTIAIVNYFPSQFAITLAHPISQIVNIKVSTKYPENGTISISINPSEASEFALQLRVPSWCKAFVARCGNVDYAGITGTFLSIHRMWKANDLVIVTINIPTWRINDPCTNSTLKALQRGPQLLSIDPEISSAKLPVDWIGTQIYSYHVEQDKQTIQWNMVPWADAGQTGSAQTAFQKIFTFHSSPSKPLNPKRTVSAEICPA